MHIQACFFVLLKRKKVQWIKPVLDPHVSLICMLCWQSQFWWLKLTLRYTTWYSGDSFKRFFTLSCLSNLVWAKICFIHASISFFEMSLKTKLEYNKCKLKQRWNSFQYWAILFQYFPCFSFFVAIKALILVIQANKNYSVLKTLWRFFWYQASQCDVMNGQ